MTALGRVTLFRLLIMRLPGITMRIQPLQWLKVLPGTICVSWVIPSSMLYSLVTKHPLRARDFVVGRITLTSAGTSPLVYLPWICYPSPILNH